MSLIVYEDVQTIISRCAAPSAKIIDYKIEPFSKHRDGIMGNHFLLIVDVQEETRVHSKRTFKFFVKSLPQSSSVHNVILDQSAFLEEVRFYNELYPRTKHRKDANIGWSPDCYLAKPDVIVLEDLRSQGYRIRDNSIFEEKYLMSALTSLAHFHAASIIMEKRLGEPLNLAYPDAFCERVFTDAGKGGRSNKLGFDTLELLAERFHLDGAQVPKILKRVYELVKPIPGGCNVLCHGDLWRGNIMFKDEEKGPDCLLVDFQMLRYASPSLDLAMMLYIHMAPEMREFSESRMLDHYYAKLREMLLRNETEVPIYEDILKDYEERRIVGLTYLSLRWPHSVIANLNDSRALESWYFHTRIDVYRSIFDSDPAYEATMKTSLERLIAEGKRISNL